MKYFDEKKFFMAEVELAKAILETQPDNPVQRDRLAHAALKLGNIKLAKQYGTSSKLLNLIADAERQSKL